MWKRNGKLYLSGFMGLTLLLGALQASAADHSRPRPPRPRVAGHGPSTRADASANNQPVSFVSFNWEVEPTGELGVHLPTGVYFAIADRDLCGMPIVNADTVKAWHSLAQAAFLAGKTVSVAYTDCGSHHYIRWLGLNG